MLNWTSNHPTIPGVYLIRFMDVDKNITTLIEVFEHDGILKVYNEHQKGSYGRIQDTPSDVEFFGPIPDVNLI
jgi:hypothetical protein